MQNIPGVKSLSRELGSIITALPLNIHLGKVLPVLVFSHVTLHSKLENEFSRPLFFKVLFT